MLSWGWSCSQHLFLHNVLKLWLCFCLLRPSSSSRHFLVKSKHLSFFLGSPPHSITCFCGCVCQSPKFKRTDQIFLSRFLNKPERREEDLSLLLYYESMCRYIEHTFIPQGTYCMIRETRVKSIYKYMRHAVRSSYCCRGCTWFYFLYDRHEYFFKPIFEFAHYFWWGFSQRTSNTRTTRRW